MVNFYRYGYYKGYMDCSEYTIGLLKSKMDDMALREDSSDIINNFIFLLENEPEKNIFGESL